MLLSCGKKGRLETEQQTSNHQLGVRGWETRSSCGYKATQYSDKKNRNAKQQLEDLPVSLISNVRCCCRGGRVEFRRSRKEEDGQVQQLSEVCSTGSCPLRGVVAEILSQPNRTSDNPKIGGYSSETLPTFRAAVMPANRISSAGYGGPK